MRVLMLAFLTTVLLTVDTCRALLTIDKCRIEWESAACDKMSLAQVPQHEHTAAEIRYLDLSHNLITKLTNSSLNEFPYLVSLTLANNSLSSLEHAFSKLHYLRHLDLSFNKIQYLDPGLFVQCKTLESLSLRGNSQLIVPHAGPLLSSESLRSLDLSICEISSIYPDTFQQIPNLNSLDLHSNRLRDIPTPVDFYNSLSDLDLVDNPWNCGSKNLRDLRWPVVCAEEESLLKTLLSWDSSTQVLLMLMPILLGLLLFVVIVVANLMMSKISLEETGVRQEEPNFTDHVYEYIQ